MREVTDVRASFVATVAASTIAMAIVLAPGTASADATCISAYEQTQTLRKDGKPVAAKAQAAICARESCPALLTKDCTKWLAELEAVIPSVVLDPRTPAGALRTDVRVKLDGAALGEKIDGKAMSLEPGSHTFVFEADGAAPTERTIVVRDGEKNKKVTVTLAPARGGENGDAKPVADRPIPLGVWIFGGASVLALATSAAFAIDGLGKKSDLDQCKPHCAAGDIDAMSTSFTLADVALGAGVMAGAAAVYLFLTRPTAEAPAVARANDPATNARVRPVPFAAPLPGGGALGITARF
ncbi:MAG: hypothetical protein JWP87_629 [Labilithrix sp.]|nr:hypothetical protein [Labilithrix sp.]